VKELNIDASKISGTGKNGRILKSDVMKFLDKQDKNEHEQELEALRSSARPATELPQGARPEERVPMTRLRARIAERLLEAQQNAAILTTFNEVDLQAIMELRNRYKETFEKQHDTRLGFMSFFVKAAVEALKKFPEVNASVDGTDIIYHGYYDIGIAVGSPRGLVVPVLRDADQLSFGEIETTIKQFGKKAQEGSLSYDELTGGTFTISNGGVYGSMLSTPILNPPQSAILGMHNIQQRPVVVEGDIVVRPMMYLALSYDHRIIDGRGAVQFLVTIKQLLEDPARMLLNV
jgi:2-oxoglutarate dehydrogenase E2 component (dihydrolipoamide succinyltransferase)